MRTLIRRRRWRLIAAVATAGVLGSSALAAGVGVAPAEAASGCTAQYIVNSDWGTGFSIAINITNNGPAVTSWTLAYSYSGNQQITAGWSGNWSQSGENITVTNASWNGSLATGATTQIGANGSYTGTNTTPTAFTLNGTACNGTGGGSNTVTVTNPGNQSGTTGTAASLQLAATDSASGQSFTWSATGLPAGLSISSSGLISGTPTTAGTSSVTVTAKDTTGATGTASFTWTITTGGGGNTVTVTNPGNESGTVGTAASLQIHASDSASGQTLTYSATGLPAGLSISSSTGLISGTPTTAGTSTVTVTVKDTTGATGTATFSWTITAASSGPPVVSITNPAAGQIFTPGSTVTLTAAPVTGAGTVTSVAFYYSTTASNNNLIGTATTSPWTVNWANVPAGSYSLTAVASNGSESLTSYPVGITVEAPTVIVNPAQVAVQQGKTVSFGVSLSAPPSASVSVSVAQNSGGDSDLSVSSGGTLTFTTSNWNVPQTVTVASGSTAADGGSQGTFSASATGYATGSESVTEALPAGSQSAYDGWFLSLYDTIMNPANGYFSPKGIPYHSVETLIVEAPDYGHETTSETYSYYLWLTADYGRATGNWTPFNNAWANMQQYMIPTDAEQPGQCAYNASAPATYGPEEPTPDKYPVTLNSSVPVGSDPLFSELKTTYGNCDMYQPMWIMDTDNRYGFGQEEDGSSTPSWINTFQRGPEESVWDTVPQPDWDTMKYGGTNGFLDLFNNGGGSFAPQYKYTDAPDADARMIQAAYWAQQWASAQGKQSQIATTLADAAKLGDFLRYSMFDKYFKQISANCSQEGSVACPAGTSKANEMTYLLSWFDAWGGSTTGAWSWRISGTEIHEGYQNPLTAWALSTDSSLIPLSPTAKGDWATSLITQLNLFKWLQSAEGGIAGGITNNWGGNYGDVAKPPSGDTTFDGMYYDPQPQYHNPPSNQWFGYQTWPMERLAEYYYATGNSEAQSILAKWVSWAESVTSFNTTTGSFCLPGTLTWSGQPDESFTTGTSNSSAPPANTGLHVSVTGCSEDIGVATSLAKVYEYYAAKSGDTTSETAAQNILDVIHKFFADPLGYSAPETRTDYINFDSAYNTTNYEGVFIPTAWSGKYPGGVPVNSSTSTFLSIRPWYIGDPQWSKVQTYLNGGAAPTFNYHRFWAEVDVATAFDTFATLFPNTAPPSGF